MDRAANQPDQAAQEINLLDKYHIAKQESHQFPRVCFS